MDLTFNAAQTSFRAEVQAFFAEHLGDDLRAAARYMTSVYSDHDTAMAWQAILYRQGWLVPSWPVQHGGTGWSLTQRYIYNCERAKAQPPALSPMGLSMLGPALLGHGTEEQKSTLLPRILDGTDSWCQGYSEPQAGSDLAGLQTSAVPDGDDYIVNGTKIWTTHAHCANRMFCLVRTGQFERPQQGVTFLLMDMTAEGVSSQPIIFTSGDWEQSQVFFDNVRVPRSNIVGEENQGWTVTKYLLEFERGGGASAPGLHQAIAGTRALWSSTTPLPTEQDFERRLNLLETAVMALEMTELRMLAEAERTGSPGPAASMLKTRSTELSQAITELNTEAAAWYGLPYQPDAIRSRGNSGFAGPEEALTAVPFYLNNRAASIYAGSNEIQRNIMAKAVLGL